MSINKYNSQTGELVSLAGGTRTWVGTKAAYEQQKQAGTLPNNCLIAITDDEEDYCHYSTEETKTGNYWIDGKPIYRKVLQYTSMQPTYDISNLNAEYMVNVSGGLITPTGNWMPLSFYEHSNYWFYFYIRKVNDIFTEIVTLKTEGVSYPPTFILEYTKSTD